jgi:hypothetical protein
VPELHRNVFLNSCLPELSFYFLMPIYPPLKICLYLKRLQVDSPSF